MVGFSKCERYEAYWICLDRVLNISWILNMPGFSIWQGYEYARITQGSKYATVWLNISEQEVNMPEYVWMFDNRQDSEYLS